MTESQIERYALDILTNLGWQVLHGPNISLNNRPETDCSLCVSACLEKAVDIVDGTIVIDRTVCDGCGLCASICPDGNITLEW